MGNIFVEDSKAFDYLIFIGRFQPFHFAHKEVIDIAFSMSHNVILILGSAQDERSIKNPFSAAEREQMIRGGFSQAQQIHLHFLPIVDLYNDVKWTQAVKDGVNTVVSAQDKVGLIGHFKDESSYYLRLFPEWQLIELENLKNALSATPLREKYYRGEIDTEYFPLNVQDFLSEFQHTKMYPVLQDYYQRQDTSVIKIEKEA